MRIMMMMMVMAMMMMLNMDDDDTCDDDDDDDDEDGIDYQENEEDCAVGIVRSVGAAAGSNVAPNFTWHCFLCMASHLKRRWLSFCQIDSYNFGSS